MLKYLYTGAPKPQAVKQGSWTLSWRGFLMQDLEIIHIDLREKFASKDFRWSETISS